MTGLPPIDETRHSPEVVADLQKRAMAPPPPPAYIPKIHVADAAKQERDKYSEIWGFEDYRKAHSPGLENVQRAVDVMKLGPGHSLVDVGCGAGVAGLAFAKLGLDVSYVDITAAGLSPELIGSESFTEAPLWADWAMGRRWDVGFCCDVMEHIPPEYTMLVIDRVLSCCDRAWFQVCFLPDNFGKLVGEPLHICVRPYAWWLERMATLADVIDARDLCGAGVFVLQRAPSVSISINRGSTFLPARDQFTGHLRNPDYRFSGFGERD